jgi:hypothetical protein
MERETGFEPATSSLGSWHSTTELLPRSCTLRYFMALRGLGRFPGRVWPAPVIYSQPSGLIDKINISQRDADRDSTARVSHPAPGARFSSPKPSANVEQLRLDPEAATGSPLPAMVPSHPVRTPQAEPVPWDPPAAYLVPRRGRQRRSWDHRLR